MDPSELVDRYMLGPHPEGGHYRRTFLDPEGRASAILYLLDSAAPSRWHRVDSVEIWTFCAGDPLELRLSRDGTSIEQSRIGVEIGAQAQIVVPAGAWQQAETTGTSTLVSCVVVPAFRWDGFELAPEGWEPGLGRVGS